jgi:hypothetical protein
MARAPPSLSQTLTRTAREQILTCHIGSGIDRNGRALGEPAALHMPPEMGQGLQCWRSDRQPPACAVPRRGHLPTRLGRMRRATLCAQHAGPSSPRRPSQRQAVWRGVVLPMVCAPPRERAGPYGAGAGEHAPGPIPGHGEAYRRPTSTGATRSGWGCRHARLLPPPSPWTPTACTAPFAPPCACRHGGARRARSSRGRVHAMSRRARARPTRRRETGLGWTSRR